MVAKNPIIVGLDLPTAKQAVDVATSLVPYVGGFKVGLGLLHGPGPGIIDVVARLGLPVFADAKLHDIPSQVGRAAERLAEHGARWVTAHVGGGERMLEAAVSGLAKGAGQGDAGILGVSVLTSIDNADLQRLGIQRTPGQLVSKMARVAAATGCEGLVCSPHELNVVDQVAPSLAKVTPGIRLAAVEDDQSRVATPAEAIERGATWLVIGRPIAHAADPVSAAKEILASMQGSERPS